MPDVIIDGRLEWVGHYNDNEKGDNLKNKQNSRLEATSWLTYSRLLVISENATGFATSGGRAMPDALGRGINAAMTRRMGERAQKLRVGGALSGADLYMIGDDPCTETSGNHMKFFFSLFLLVS